MIIHFCFDTSNIISDYFYDNSSFFLNLLVIIFYALLNEDFDLDIEDNDDDDDFNEDLDKHIDKNDKKKK
jgi:hypothetical protein